MVTKNALTAAADPLPSKLDVHRNQACEFRRHHLFLSATMVYVFQFMAFGHHYHEDHDFDTC